MTRRQKQVEMFAAAKAASTDDEKNRQSRRGRASRAKGASGEREVCSLGAQYGFAVKRTLVQVRGGDDEAGDVCGFPGLRPEVKLQKKPNAMRAYAEAEAVAGNDIAIAFTRALRSKWMVTIAAADFLAIYRDALAFRTSVALHVVVGDEPCPPNDRTAEVPRA